jgi:hypothetical protein
LIQLVDSGLITDDQYVGVEGNEQWYYENLKVVANSPYKCAKLFHGEITDIMDQELGKGKFNPGIVYLDTISEPKHGSKRLVQTLGMLKYAKGPVLLVWNVVIRNGRANRSYSWQEVGEIILKNPVYNFTIKGWKQYKGNLVAKYNGTGHSSTKMGTVILYKQ